MKPFIFRILYKLQILRLFPQFYFHYQVKKHIKKNDVVLDIGANQGIYTRIFFNLGANVIAVEPLRMFWDSLTKISRDILTYPFALGNEVKTTTMKKWRNSSGAYSIAEGGSYYIQLIKGSILFNDLLQINFIKIDVEGSELPIIEDMAELILKHKPTILIETGKISEVLNYLPGYKIKDRMSNDYLIGV